MQNENRAVDRFLSRISDAILFCDDGFAAIAERAPDPGGRYTIVTLPQSPDLLDPGALVAPGTKRKVFLFSADQYPAFEARIAPAVRQAGGTFHSWPYDVFGAFVCVDESWNLAGTPLQPPGRTYVITCTARSGSTFLSDILARNGLGNPKEHIRGPMIDFVKKGGLFDLDVPRLLTTLASRGQRNGIFGTKIISGFYWDLLGALSQRDQDAFLATIWSHPVVYLVRESKVEQAVSDFVARETRIWHVRQAGDLDRYNQLTTGVRFNFDEINKRFGMYLKDETRLREFVGKLPSVLTVSYADLTRNTQRVADTVAAFVSGGTLAGPVDVRSDVIKTFNGVNRAFCEQFVAEARRRGVYAERRDDPLVAELMG